MSFQKKILQNDTADETLSYSISSYTISTNNNLMSSKKFLSKEDNSNMKLISTLIEGFFEMKKKLDKETLQELKKINLLELDKEKLSKMDPTQILMSTKDIAKHLIEIYENESEENTSPSNHYEKEIQKLEADVRHHIRLEQQMKLCVEKNEEKIAEYEKIGRDKNKKEMEHLNQEAQQLKNEIDKKEKELEKLHMELKQKNKIILNQEEDLKSLQKQKIMKERVPLQDENKKNAKEYEQQQYENDLEKKIGKENFNHKRSTSGVFNSAIGYGMLLNEKSSSNNNNKNQKKEEQSSSFLKPTQTKNTKIQENPYFNKKLKFPEKDDQKTLYSTFAGCNNFPKELKNSPFKKTHYNINEANSKFAMKESNNNFSNIENDERSRSVDPNSKIYHLSKEFSKGRDSKEKIDEKTMRNKSSLGGYLEVQKNNSSSNLNKSSRDSSRLRGQKIPLQ